MRTIDRIKDELDQRNPWSEDVAALVAYYEAAEEWIRGDWDSDDPRMVNLKMGALDKARAALEKED